MNTTGTGEKPKKFRSPLAITGFVLLFLGILIAGLMFILKAEPTNSFYSITGTGLGFLVINPFILRMRNSLLWQGLMIGTAITSIAWLLS